MRTRALANKILRQLRHDKRTIALLLVAPIAMMSLFYGVLTNGNSDLFNRYGAALIGIIVFFFVFIVGGINLLNEKTSGTLERLLATTIRRRDVIFGYIIGFGILTVCQAVIIVLFNVYVLGISMEGSLLWVIMITLLAAINGLALGMLISTFANSEFQVVQFIPIVILPQIIFSGIFPLSGVWESISYFVPLHYVTEALEKVMLDVSGFFDIWIDTLVLVVTTTLIMIINTLILKKYRNV